MIEPVSSLLAHVSRPLELVEEYDGGQGRTLRVVDHHNQHFVLRILPAGESSAEASVVASVAHPMIPAIHEIGRLPDDRVFVLRDHVDGKVLKSLPREPVALHHVLQQLLEVIAFVHLRGVLHLDLKPSNMVLDDDGQLHLLDFGLAVRSGSDSQGGTLFFAAPEVLLGAIPDQRADLFSIGAMVAHALIPADRLDLVEFVRSFPSRSFFEACMFDAGELPAQFGQLIRGCVARQPVKRFPDADSALDALCGTGTGRPSVAALTPDPVQIFAPELAGLMAAKHDVRITGGEARDRRAIAMQLLVTMPDVTGIVDRVDDALLQRDGKSGTRLHLPDLTAERLSPHVATTLGLEGRALDQATAWLLSNGSTSGAISDSLRGLVERGELLPAGTRWVWPAARSGQIGRSSSVVLSDASEPIAEQVRQAMKKGMIERARYLWLQADDRDESDARFAFVEGLLGSGEAARALPICSELPVLRAQALVDTGQYELAAQELAPLGAATDPRHRRVAAKLAMARGEHDRAYELLEYSGSKLADHLLRVAVLVQSGKLAECEQLIQQCQSSLDSDEDPYASASLLTSYGHLERLRGNLDAARLHFENAVEFAQRIGNLRHAASSHLNLGVVAKDMGEHAEAASRFREANALYESLGDQGRAAIAKANLGIAALARDDIETARTTLSEAVSSLLQLGDTETARLSMIMLARAHVRAGDVAEAEAALALVGVPDTIRLREEAALVQKEMAEKTREINGDKMRQGSEDGPNRELFRMFLAVNRKLAQAVELDEAMHALLDAAVTLTGGRHGYLLVMRSDGIRREFQSGQMASTTHAFSRSLANQSVQEQRTLTGLDVLANEELQAMQSVRNLRIRSAICSPFHSAGGTQGAVYVEHPGRAGVFSEHDKDSLEILADQAAIAVDRMLREEEMRAELTDSKRALVVATRSSKRQSNRLLGNSASMNDLRAQIDKLASLDLSILIQGETGTGKELVARALHDRGGRSKGPFVAENCSVLPAELMESELFGHVAGAFTGADRDKPGLFELANGGTLFLDEVGDMPPALQVKLLRALQEQRIRRVGGEEAIELDVRMVAATHKNLREMVQAGDFREDLFFRLAAVEVNVPPLRERSGDVEVLAKHFVEMNSVQRAGSLRVSKVAMAALSSYSWPGNVRELEHVIARAVILCESDELVDLQLPQERVGKPSATDPVVSEVLTIQEAERRAIVVALSHFGGDKSKASKGLGISRTALYDKIKRHNLNG
ncbi:sigma 54-interacting transcriptional regulator [bacterium]|nr:sigma 54-interacting transcriptional regulator [bacterium]